MQTLTRGSFARASASLGFKTGDWRLAHPVHRHRQAPCGVACPAGENPQAYLAKSAEGDLRSAWEILVSANPMPAVTGRVCPHPCERACNRGSYDEAIAIHSVERFLGDRAIAEGWSYPVKPPPADAPEIAIVGSGPAGLSAAYHLLKLGCKPTVFEAQGEAGGLLRSALAPYRLPRDVLDMELERLLGTGIVLERGRCVGRGVHLDELRTNFRAVFIAIGAGRPREWSVNGAAPNDLRSGIDFLKEWISIGALPAYQRIAIVGGGNAAIDLARILKFNGTSEVHVITFQALPGPGIDPKDAMSAAPREIRQAIEEGTTIHDRRGIARLILRGGEVVGVEMVHMKEMERPGGKRELVSFEGTETVLKVDLVIPAVGQTVDPAGFESLLGTNARFMPDAFGRLPEHDGIFAGGDAARSGGTVSGAIGDGHRAAIAIRSYIDGRDQPRETVQRAIGFGELNVHYFDHEPRAEASIVAPANRSAEAEIEGALSRASLNAEVRRCFSCGECMSCDNCWTLCPDNSVLKVQSAEVGGWSYVFDYDHCKGCGICAHECPVGFIAMIDEA